MITETHYGIVPCTKTRVRCVFCGVFIPKANKCIEEHNNGAKHTEHMELVNENGIVYNVNQGLYCRLCSVNIPENDSIIQHLQLETHANFLATLDDLIDGEFILVDDFLAGQSDEALCSPCQKHIPCTLQSIEAHVNENTHHDNMIDTLKPLNGLFEVDGCDQLWCKICHVYLDESLEGIIDHIENTDEHAEWIEKMIHHSDENGIYIGNYLAHEFENKAYCFKCRAEILCNINSVDYHVQTEAHLNSEFPEASVTPPFVFSPYHQPPLM